MVPLIKYLPQKQKDLCSDPGHLHKKLGMVGHACNPRLVEVSRDGEPLKFTGELAQLKSQAPDSIKELASKIKMESNLVKA